MQRVSTSSIIVLGVVFGAASQVRADNFAAVRYDAKSDELIVTMNYRGSNPDHAFTLQWDACKTHAGSALNEVGARVLDDQWKDVAQKPYRKTVHFGLQSAPCRPAKLTLYTAPRFYYTITIPDNK